jgi:hypothetical protein
VACRARPDADDIEPLAFGQRNDLIRKNIEERPTPVLRDERLLDREDVWIEIPDELRDDALPLRQPLVGRAAG